MATHWARIGSILTALGILEELDAQLHDTGLGCRGAWW
jgi:hypothetical protein